MPIERATLFNVASEDEGKKIIEAYKTMKSAAKKVCNVICPVMPSDIVRSGCARVCSLAEVVKCTGRVLAIMLEYSMLLGSH